MGLLRPGWEVVSSALSPALHYNPVIEAIWWEGSQAGRLQVIRSDGEGGAARERGDGCGTQPGAPRDRGQASAAAPAPRCPLGPPPAPPDTAPLPVPSASLLWTVCWRRCPAARRGSVLVCRGSWRAPVLCFAPSSPAWGGGAAAHTLRGSRSGGAGDTGPGGRAEPSRPAEPWRPGYPAETVAPSPLPTDGPGVPGLQPAPGRGPGPRSQPQPPPSPPMPQPLVCPPQTLGCLCAAAAASHCLQPSPHTLPLQESACPRARAVGGRSPPCGAELREPTHRPLPGEGDQGSSRFGAQRGAKQSRASSNASGGRRSISAHRQQTQRPGDGGGGAGERGWGGQGGAAGERRDVDAPLANTRQGSINC